MATLTDEELAVIDRIATFGLGKASALRVHAALAELRSLRAILATPMPCGWDEPRAFPDGHVVRCHEVDCDDPGGMHGHGIGPRVYAAAFAGTPDEAIALGSALIRAGLRARGEK